MRARQILIALVLALAACGADDSATGDDAPDPDGYIELAGADWTLAPGSESYLCVTRTVTEDLWIDALRPVAPPGTHHTVLSVGAPEGADGITECDGATQRGTVLFASGVGTEPLVLPEGQAAYIRAGQQLHLNLHIFNVGAATLAGHAAVDGRLASGTPDEVGFILIGSERGEVVPPGRSTITFTCDAPVDSDVFAVMPHMHLLGRHLRVVAGPSATQTVLIDQDYTFDSQRYTEIDPPIEIRAGTAVRVECTYDNASGAPVPFGESTAAEMCLASLGTTRPWGLGATCAR